ncbi:hypothetical protein AAC387_Pa10g0452 [Persea americana]
MGVPFCEGDAAAMGRDAAAMREEGRLCDVLFLELGISVTCSKFEEECPLEIASNHLFYPSFKDCVGAIDEEVSMLPSFYSSNYLLIYLIFFQSRSFFTEEPSQVQGSEIKQHFLLPSLKLGHDLTPIVLFMKRSELCDPKPSPLSYMKNEHICGCPLGLRFDKKTGDLYIADAYFGLMKVGPEGGLATSPVTEAEGVPLRFTNDLDIDDEGNIYFTDSSAHYQRRNFMQLVFSAENSGRLLKYEPLTQRTTVLLQNLQLPNSVSMSRDGSFFVFSEGSLGR